MAKYEYMVRTDKAVPWLIRFGDAGAEAFHFPGKWEPAPHLNSIRYGQGAFMDYDDISEQEAMKYQTQIQGHYDKMKAKGG